MTEPEPMILLDDIRLSLTGAAGRVDILRGASLRVAAGEAVGLVGPCGSGKSTLLMVIAGLERPTGGRVRVAGADRTEASEDALARLRRDTIGIVFQSFHLIPTMTALENVAVPLELAGHKDAAGRAKAELAAVGLGHRLGHYPAQLSGGVQQRVALARAVAPRPALLLADEPTGNLDRETGAKVLDLLLDARARYGATLFLVTHDDALAARCDRVLRIADGKVTDGRIAGETAGPRASGGAARA
jgi:putative ABC transport system ATP-binding protein